MTYFFLYLDPLGMSLYPVVAYRRKKFLMLVLLPDSPAFFALEQVNFHGAHQQS
jgi:hypothetical protein